MTTTTDLIEKPCTYCGQPVVRSARSWRRSEKRGYRPVCGPICRNALFVHDHPRPVKVYLRGRDTPFKPQTPEEHVVASEYVAVVRAGREAVPPESGEWTQEQMIKWERADAAETALWHTLVRLRALRGNA